MTPADIFSQVSSRFDPEKAKGVEMSLVFNLTGDNGGVWAVDVHDGKCEVTEAPIENPTATVTMDAADYVAMTNGDLNPMMAFMSGKVKVEGDLNSVMKFQQVFGL